MRNDEGIMRGSDAGSDVRSDEGVTYLVVSCTSETIDMLFMMTVEKLKSNFSQCRIFKRHPISSTVTHHDPPSLTVTHLFPYLLT